jgi:hypothetical protein
MGIDGVGTTDGNVTGHTAITEPQHALRVFVGFLVLYHNPTTIITSPKYRRPALRGISRSTFRTKAVLKVNFNRVQVSPTFNVFTFPRSKHWYLLSMCKY